MDNNQIIQTATAAEELLTIIINLYSAHLNALEAYIEKIPENETEVLTDFYNHVSEVQSAMEHDIGLFDKAVNIDNESLHSIKDKLKIYHK